MHTSTMNRIIEKNVLEKIYCKFHHNWQLEFDVVDQNEKADYLEKYIKKN